MADKDRFELSQVTFCRFIWKINMLKFAIIAIGIPTGVYGVASLWKHYNIGVPAYDLPGDLKKYVIIVTGADRGIGKATTKAMAEKGARVLMACRDIESCKKIRREIVLHTKNRHVVCRECDLSSFESIKKFAARVIEEEPKVDVLINNAGVKYINPRRATRERLEYQMGVNYFGHYLLTLLLLDKLKESAPSRIINVVGKAYSLGKIDFDDLNFEKNYNQKDAYDRSKLAIVLSTKELAKQLEGTGVGVMAVDPGYTFSNIDRYTEGYYTKHFRNLFFYIFRRTEQQGAYPLLYSAISMELNDVNGKYIGNQLKFEDFSENAQNPLLQRKLWLTSQKWVRLNQAYDDVKNYVKVLQIEAAEKLKEEKYSESSKQEKKD